VQVAAPVQQATVAQSSTDLEIVPSRPRSTPMRPAVEDRGQCGAALTFTAGGQVVVLSIVHGLGHGLDEEARRVAQQIRFHPASRNGQAVDSTTNITITFQLA